MSNYLKGEHVADPVLAGVTRGYKNVVFIGERTLPVVLTDREGMRVSTFRKTALVEHDIEHVVEAGNNTLVCEKTGTLDLVLDEHGLAASADYHKRAKSMFNEESKAIRHATNGVNLRRELIAVRLAQDGEVYRTKHIKELTASDCRAGGKGNPIGMIEAGMEAARTAMGPCPNLVTVRVGVMTLLKFHPAIQAAIGANERKRTTTEVLQDPFRIKEVVIGAPVSLPSMKAVTDKNSMPADIWGDNLMLRYVGKSQPGAGGADEDEPSFGYTLRRKGTPVADKCGGAGGKVKHCRYTGVYRVAVVGDNIGYLITGISK